MTGRGDKIPPHGGTRTCGLWSKFKAGNKVLSLVLSLMLETFFRAFICFLTYYDETKQANTINNKGVD